MLRQSVSKAALRVLAAVDRVRASAIDREDLPLLGMSGNRQRKAPGIVSDTFVTRSSHLCMPTLYERYHRSGGLPAQSRKG
jgi:hypothetical protein